MRDDELVDRLRARESQRNTSGFSVLDFLGPLGSTLDALLYARLFWPSLVEYRGLVLRSEVIQDDEDRGRVDQALAHYSGKHADCERDLNALEVPSGVFGGRMAESTDSEDRSLADLLVRLWTHRLSDEYPDETFRVQLLEPEETGGEVAVTFWRSP